MSLLSNGQPNRGRYAAYPTGFDPLSELIVIETLRCMIQPHRLTMCLDLPDWDHVLSNLEMPISSAHAQSFSIMYTVFSSSVQVPDRRS
jgi:hypothetical protein